MIKSLLSSIYQKKNKNLSFSKSILLGIITLGLISGSLQSQITTAVTMSGTPISGSPFASFSAAVTAVNGLTITGPVIMNLTAAQTETLTAKITMTATGTSSNTITIKKSGAGAKPKLIGYTGTNPTPQITGDGMLVFAGTDHMTLDSVDFEENAANTTTTTQMKFAIAFAKQSGADGCQFNTVKNCAITLNRLNNTNWNGVGHTGSCGIVVLNTLHNAIGTVTVTAASGSNSFNKFQNNTIQNCNAGIVYVAFGAAAGVGPNPDPATFLGDLGNEVGGSSTTGNSILNFGGGAAAANPSSGMFANHQWSMKVTHNTINNNNGSGVNHINTLRGLFFNSSSTSASLTCTNNIVTIKGGGTTSQVTGIESVFGATAAGNRINITNNTINMEYLTATTGICDAIWHSSSADTVWITNNVINPFNYSATALTGSGAVNGIRNSGAATRVFIQNNQVLGINRTGTTGGTTIGINCTSGTNQIVKNNIVKNLKIDGAGTASTMNGINTAGTTVVVDSNTITNLQVAKTTGTGNLVAINNPSVPNNENFNYNTVDSLIHLGPVSNTAAFVYGLDIFTTGGTRTVSYNKISNIFSNMPNTGGIRQRTSTIQLFNNLIRNITSYNSTTSCVVDGIRLESGTSANIYNNFISNITAPFSLSGNAVRGINVSSTATPANIYYNTIKLDTAGNNLTSTGTNFGGSGIFLNSATQAFNVINNYITVKGTPNGTGSFSAIRRIGVTSSVNVAPANITMASNVLHTNSNTWNFLYVEGDANPAGFGNTTSLRNGYNAIGVTNDATNNIVLDAGFNTSCGLFKQWKSCVNCFTENNLTASSPTGAFVPSSPSLAQNSAVAIATPNINFDHINSSRGTTPDIGALEFSGAAIDLSGPTISFTPKGNVNCTGIAVNISADITDNTGVNTTSGTKPRLYYRKTTDPDTFVSANNNSAPGWKWVEATNASSPFTFTYDWAKFAAAPVLNDVITYFFSAQDIVGTPNVSINAATLVPSTSCPSSVAIGATAGLTNATSIYNFSFDAGATVTFDVTKNPVCSGSPDTIKANFILNGAANLGTSITSGSATGQSPFMGGWGGTKTQFLIQASELDAIGLKTGDIKSIELFPTSSGATYEGFQIWLGNTTQTDMSTAFIDTANLTKVYEATAALAAYTPTANQWNRFTVGTSPASPLGSAVSSTFTWDGTSNLLVCYSMSENPIAGNVTASNCQFHTTSFVSTRKSQADNLSMAAMLGQTTSSIGTASSRPNIIINGRVVAAHSLIDTNLGYVWSPGGLGTARKIFPFPAISPTTKYKVTATDVNGCTFNDSVSINVDTLPKSLRVFNSFQCGAGVPPISFKVRDSNGFTSPTINWYASMAATTPLQSSTDTIFTSTVAATSTMFVSVQSPAGCWSPRVPITLTVNTSDSILGRANGVRDTIRVCSGSPVNLTAINVQMPSITKSFDTFTWTSNDPNSGIGSPVVTTNGNHTFTPVIGGHYQLYVNAIDTGSGCSAVDTIKFSVQSNPFAGASKEIIAVPNPVCIGNNVTHLFVMSDPSSVMPTGYCSSAATSTGDEDIDSVSFGVIQNNTGCPSTLVGSQGTATGTADFYSDFTASAVPVPDVIAGNTYPFNLNMVSCGGAFTNSAEVYIDWNRDGDFGDAGEENLVWNNINNASINQSINITVPANASIGKTRMRVSVRELAATGFNSCHNVANNWGETEDYVINIKAVPTGTAFEWKSNQTGATVLGTANPLVHALPAATTIYNLKLTNGVCVDSLKDTITNAVPPLATTTIAGPTSACFGDQLRLSTNTTGGCTPYSYSWFVVGGTGGTFTAVGSLNNDTIIFNPTGATGARSVRVVVTDPFGAKDSSTHVISYNNPIPTAIVADTVCGVQAGTLGATASPATDILRWYASPTSFEALGVGSSFTTPPVSANTKFYVRQFTSVVDSANPFTSSTFGNATLEQGIRMDVTKKLILTHADIYPFGAPNSSGTLSVELRDNFGTPIGSVNNIPFSYNTGGAAATTAATATPVTIPLGILVQPGTGYDLVLTAISGAQLAHNNAGLAFPYNTSTGSLSITIGKTAFGTTAFSRFNFFNLKTEEGCWGGPVQDSVSFITPPAITLSRKLDSVCSLGSTIPVTLTAPSPLSTYNSYTWTPNTAISGDSSIGYVFSETAPATHTYVLRGTQSTGMMCVNTDTFKFKVKPIPPVIQRTPTTASVDICNGTIQQLDALGFRLTNHVVGTATTTGAAVGQSPFMGGWGGTKSQYIIRASELPAGGVPRTLKSIAMRATTSGTTYEGFQIYVGHTTLAQFTAPGDINPLTGVGNTPATPLTRVYEANAALAAYTPIATGAGFNNTFTFGTAPAAPLGGAVSNEFLWDGVSNIVVLMSWSENPAANNSTGSNFEYSNPGFVASMRRQLDNLSMADMLTTTTGGSTSTSTTARPNMQFVFEDGAPITWSPSTSLYTNSGATTAYTGTNNDTVYAAPTDTIKYYVTATFPNSCTRVDSITLNVKDTVTINTQPPAFATFCAGDTLKLCVSASSTSPMTYQWKKNGLNISCGLNATACTPCLSIANATQADSGTYEVDITTGTPCGTKTSIASEVKVRLPITITTQPKDTTVCVGAPFAVSAAASNDSSRVWTQIGGTNTGTTNTFSVTSSAYTDSGKYFITYIPQTPCPAVNSDTVMVRILPPALISTDPASLTTLCIGDSVTLKATHSGALSFQWLKNGVPVGSATTDSLIVKANTLSDSGEYRLVVYSPTGCTNDTTTINTGVIKINLPVSITVQPLAHTYVCQNSPFNASVTASNTSGYQWEKDMTTIFAATNNNFTIPSAQPSDAGVFRVLVKGLAPCPDVYSTNDTLTVTTLAAITTPPSAFQVCEDQSISITGSATNAASYVWLLNGTNISTANPYTKASATMADSGMYRLVALSNPAGATTCKADTSAAVLGAVVRKIAITTQPLANTFVCQNSAFNTSIVAQNVTGYQWKKGGTNVSIGTGGTSANYSIASTQPGDAGVYSVEMVGNTPCPNVTSSNDTLTVTTLAAITTQPTAFQVCEDQSINISGSATNAASYVWLLNGTNISTSNPYNKATATMADSGMYRLVALSNPAGATACKADTSAAVLGAVVRKIVITSQPPVFSYGCINANFSMNIVAQNVTAYAWRLNGTPIGQTTATMSRTPFTMADTGNYTVVMTGNTPCPSVTSNIAKVDPTTAAVITTEPVSTDVCLGNNLTLTVAASAVTTYQWRKNGVNISGQTGTSLTINPVAYADAATYDVIAVAFNGCTNDTSVGAVVSVKTPLAITSPLANTDVKCEGQNISYTTGASGDGPFTYTWTLNGSNVGTNSTNYAKTSVLVADSGRYIVNIQGSMACPALRDTIDLDVNKAPVIVTQPNGASPVCLGTNIVLNAAAANHTTLEWHKQGTGNLGQIGNTYTSSGSTTADAGNYFVIAKAQTACSDLTSSIANIVVNIPVTISLQPKGKDLLDNQSHTMSVIASGTGPFNYQWLKDGAPIIGANSSSYAINNYVAALDSGLYCCQIMSPAPCSNTVITNCVTIASVKCPKISNDTIRAINICAGRPFSLDVNATGAASYQWFRNGVALSNSNAPNYSIPKASPSDAGIYRCRVFAFNEAICDATYTDSILVTVKDKPTITSHPQGIQTCAASVHTMRVAATFGETYQWYRNGIAISPNGDKDSFVYNSVNTIGDVFYVEVGNNLCPSTNSNSVVIKSVIPGNQVFLANNTEFDLIERCTDANGWTYYATTTQTERLLMAIKKNGNIITAKPDLELMNGIREISAVNVENKGAILGGRIFNLDITGTIARPYEVKFYYNKAEGDAVLARLNDIKLANLGQFSTERIDLTLLVTTQQPFTSSLWNNLTVPLSIPHTISHRDKEFGIENGVNFVTLKNLVSPTLGGTLYMDYTLKSSSSITSTNANGFGFSMYPVPTTNGKVTVDVSSKRMKPITFTVTDMTGRVVAVFNEKHTSLESSHAFDFSQLANGNYQLMISNDEESAIGKFTISK